MPTQLQHAQQGRITPEMAYVAEQEELSPETVRDLIAEERLSIEGVSSNTDPRDRIAHFEVRLTVKDAGELSKLQRRLARIPNVFKVRRGS